MKKIEKIMLALPNNRWDGTLQWNNFPYTLGMLTSVLKDRYDVRILDAGFYNLSEEETRKQIAKYNPDIFAVSCLSPENDRGFRKLTSLSKTINPETKIVVGGIYPTLLPKKIMENVDIDFAILGEGEYRLPELLKRIEREEAMEGLDGLVYRFGSNLIIQEVESHIQKLDELPLPCYENIDFSAYANVYTKKAPHIMARRFPYAQTMTSRGCPLNCIFCSSRAINGPKIRYRSADSVLKEIDFLVQKYKIKELIFLDDNFYLNKARAKKILEGVIERDYDLEWKTINSQIMALDDKMIELIKKSGCYQLTIAPECGSEEQLKLIGKPIGTYSRAKTVVKKAKEVGLNTMATFVIGIPGETWEQIRKTGEFAEELDLDYAVFNIATPLPRTRLYQIAKRENLLPVDFNFDTFRGFGVPNIFTKEFTPEELLMFRIMEWDRINFKTPEKIKKVAELCGLTLEEAEDWRVSTRRSLRKILDINP